jgi:lysophospholipase L1-like esterase
MELTKKINRAIVASILVAGLFGTITSVGAAPEVASTPQSGGGRLLASLEAGEQRTVVVYGTSLTKVGAWSDQLRAVLEQNYPGQVTLINSAQGGSNSVWGRQSFDEKVLQKHPDTVFIEFAINDSVTSRKVSISDARENLVDMIDRLLESNSNCEIILMTMNPAVAHHGTRRPDVAAYYQMYRDVAKERGFQLIDHYPHWEKLLNEDPGRFLSYVPDGIHPVREGTLQVILPTMMQSLGLKQGKPELNERAPCWNYLLKGMDKGKKRDKQVSLKEYQMYWKDHYKRHDTDKDGLLQSGEYIPAVMFQYLDADNDGVITLEEYQAVYAPIFERYDLNSDGVLDRAEINAVK